MNKYIILGILDFVFLFILSFMFFSSHFDIFLLILVIIELFMVYKLLIQRDYKILFNIYCVLSFAIPFWFTQMFVGYFYAYNFVYPALVLVAVIFQFLYIRKLSYKIAIFVVLMTILVFVVSFKYGFEESYCLNKGLEVDRSGSEMIVATKDDELKLKEYNVTEGAQIGSGFRIHMLCHVDFNFISSLKEQYLFNIF